MDDGFRSDEMTPEVRRKQISVRGGRDREGSRTTFAGIADLLRRS